MKTEKEKKKEEFDKIILDIKAHAHVWGKYVEMLGDYCFELFVQSESDKDEILNLKERLSNALDNKNELLTELLSYKEGKKPRMV